MIPTSLSLFKRSTFVNLRSTVKYNNKITNRSRWTVRPSAAISVALQIGGARIVLLHVTYWIQSRTKAVYYTPSKCRLGRKLVSVTTSRILKIITYFNKAILSFLVIIILVQPVTPIARHSFIH